MRAQSSRCAEGRRSAWPSQVRQGLHGLASINLPPRARFELEPIPHQRITIARPASVQTMRTENMPETVAQNESRPCDRSVHTHTRGAAHLKQPHRYGSVDAQSRGAGQCANTTKRPLLCPTRQRWLHHLGGDTNRAGRAGLYFNSRNLQRRAD